MGAGVAEKAGPHTCDPRLLARKDLTHSAVGLGARRGQCAAHTEAGNCPAVCDPALANLIVPVAAAAAVICARTLLPMAPA